MIALGIALGHSEATGIALGIAFDHSEHHNSVRHSVLPQ